jgi:hypothetical protein
MATKTRLANKTIWALEDIVSLCQETRGSLNQALARGKRHMDPVPLAAVADVSQRLAEIEGLARDARQGRYRRGDGAK